MAGGERRVRASVARDVAGGRARFRSEALIAGWLQIEHAVADEGHYAARRAHPTNLAVEGGQVEPMGGLGDGDQAGAAIGEVELFGRCAPTGDALARGWCLRSGRCWSRGRRPHGRAARKTMGGGVGLRPGKHLAHRAGGGEVQGIDIDLPNLDIDPPSLEIDPRKMDIDLRSLDIDLPSLDIHLPRMNIDPPSLDIDPPKMNIDPPGVDVECFCIKVDVPGMSGRGLARRPPAVGLRWGCCRRRNPCVSGCS